MVAPKYSIPPQSQQQQVASSPPPPQQEVAEVDSAKSDWEEEEEEEEEEEDLEDHMGGGRDHMGQEEAGPTLTETPMEMSHPAHPPPAVSQGENHHYILSPVCNSAYSNMQ